MNSLAMFKLYDTMTHDFLSWRLLAVTVANTGIWSHRVSFSTRKRIIKLPWELNTVINLANIYI